MRQTSTPITKSSVVIEGNRVTVTTFAGEDADGDERRVTEDRQLEWHERPWGMLLLTALAGLLVAGLVFLLGWR